MISIRKWIAAKISVPSQMTLISSSSSSANGSEGGSATAAGSSSRSAMRPHLIPPSGDSASSSSSTHHNHGTNGNSLIKFYYADEELNLIASELDSFDGRKDPVRCTALVNQLRSAQDKVICLLFQLMDDWKCMRADRDYRLKFPDDLVSGGENGESLNGQIWFGAECLAAGSNIMHHEAESEMLRPMAKVLTNTLDNLRMELRQALSDIETSFFIFTNQLSLSLSKKLEHFDSLFATFEYEYVKAMLPIKSADEIEKLHELTVLFSEAVSSALKRGLISQEELEECQPHVLIAIPRLAIIYGLIQCSESPIHRPQKDQLSSIFRPFHNLLHRVRELIVALRPIEVEVLEKMLRNEETVNLQQHSHTSHNNSNTSSHHSEESSHHLMIASSEHFLKGNSGQHNICASVKKENRIRGDETTSSTFKHKRRHSDPSESCAHRALRGSRDSCLKDVRSASTSSLMNVINSVKGSSPAPIIERTSGRSTGLKKDREESLSSLSIETTASSTNDSFELALAVAAKSSQYISAETRLLLHRLFITIAGIADQLQSNYANDLRIILRQVFKMYGESDGSDDVSVEEALEARENDGSASTSSTKSSSSSSSSSSVTTPTSSETVTQNFAFHSSTPADAPDASSGVPHHHMASPAAPSSLRYRSERIVDSDGDEDSDEEPIMYLDLSPHPQNNRRGRRGLRGSNGRQEMQIDPVLIAPVWVPDEMVNCCNQCEQTFTIIRRRHHCRNCGQIYCNQCSSHSLPLVQYGYTKPVRVCDLCYISFRTDVDQLLSGENSGLHSYES